MPGPTGGTRTAPRTQTQIQQKKTKNKVPAYTVFKEKIVQILGTFSDLWEFNPRKRVFVIYGGAGSGKSVAVAQKICQLFCEEKGVRILVVRKTLPSLKITAYQLILDILDSWGIPYEHNKSDRTLKYGKNVIYFTGMDNPEKIKSSEYNYEWAEEATDLNKKDFLQLNLRLRRKHPEGKTNQVFLTFNPIDSFHWLITDIVEAPPNKKIKIHHSTYKDNPFLSQDTIDELERLVEQDANYYRIYCLGLPGILENIIYKNYKIEEAPKEAGLFIRDADAIGLDFGFNNQTAMVAVRFYEGRFYLKELFYATGYTNEDLIAWMKEHLPNKNIPIYADAAEPQRIEEIRRAGFNIWPAKKEVTPGIDHCKSQELIIDPDSPNIITEIRNYKWREDKDGRVLDEPVKFRDHLMDAIRYALYTMAAGAIKVPVSVLDKKTNLPSINGPAFVETNPIDLEDPDYADPADLAEDEWDIPGLA